MQEFAQQLPDWAPFFSAVAQVAGALLGLVFVALTFNGKLGGGGDVGLGQLARQTFADFLNVLIVSLTMLVPHIRADNVGLFTILFGGFGAGRILKALSGMLRSPERRASGRALMGRFFLSLLGNAGLISAGIMTLVQGQISAFWSTLFASIIGLLVSGARSAWVLVVPEPPPR